MSIPQPADFFRQKHCLMPGRRSCRVAPPPVHGRSPQLLEDFYLPCRCSGTSHRSAQLQKFLMCRQQAPTCPLTKMQQKYNI
ncbi:hypothetical protein J6590_078149 [Homalodisca vitripennis]|nr:hypothetical protein J6590_078149 [Homalodisca vitripennis]